MNSGTCGLHGKLRKIFGLNLKSKHRTRPTFARVPVARNLNGVALFKNRLEDRLLGQARRKSPEATVANKREFDFADRAIKGGDRCRRCILHSFTVTTME
jgi:hypothetical protein